MQSASETLPRRYLDGLAAKDASAVLSLFAPGARVDSPLYGELPATEFFPILFADTSAATLALRAVMRGETVAGIQTIAFWFHFGWLLPDGTEAPFSVVDIAELDASGLISRLNIVYDTVDVRPAFEAATGRASHRER